VLYREELEMLSSRLDLHVVHILSEPMVGWQGEHGLLTQTMLDRQLPADRDEVHFFICGPTVMTQLAERWLAALGIRPSRIHNELFEWV
jgi:ferredoxin-NADP reductase